MTHIQLRTPEPFNFKQPDDWPKWKRRFEQFRVASGLDDKSENQQINTLLYCLGEEAESVLASTKITDEEKLYYSKVIEKFDDFFQVRKNVIFERARFNRRVQLPDESAEQYIMQLYKLAESCDYKDYTEEMIRDRLVVGIRDSALSQRLHLDPDLNLEKATKQVRQREAVHEHQQVLKGSDRSAANVETIRPRQRPKRPVQSTKTDRAKPKTNSRQQRHCSRCGKDQHPKEKCPAKDATCHRCQRKGHYSAQCYSSKAVSEMNGEDHLDSAYLDTVTDNQESTWLTKVTLNGQEFTFKLDTGAEVTAISEQT